MLIAWFYIHPVLSLHRIIVATIFTAITISRTNSFAPDVNKARIAARQTLALVQRKPSIDSYSQDGLKLVRRVM